MKERKKRSLLANPNELKFSPISPFPRPESWRFEWQAWFGDRGEISKFKCRSILPRSFDMMMNASLSPVLRPMILSAID
jgi:hypothetical protein